MKDTAIESIKAFSVLSAPGHVGSTVIDVVDQQQVKVKDRVSPEQEITRVTDIQPRVDPRAMEEQVIVPSEEITEIQAIPQAELESRLRSTKVSDPQFRDIYDELQRRKKAEVPPISDILKTPEVRGEQLRAGGLELTPTEPTAKGEVTEVEAAEIESGLAAKLKATVTPKLYIGNVTQRMKKKFADIFGKETGDVKPFLEGPYPTKRTAIEMTAEQAFDTLILLETSLEQRLNDNLVRTENDLAKANADWGDIKELRKVLDLPKVTRPFTVTRATKPLILTPSTVNQRIAFSVQLSKAVDVTTTKVKQLNIAMAAMRKGGKLATKFFREVQYIRRQIQLHKSLVAKIKAEPSKNLDPFYAKAIKEIQSAIDFKADPEAKEGLRKHLNDNPDKKNEIPEDVLESLDKRDVDSLSMSQLAQIHSEIRRLAKLGRLKSKLMRKQRKALTKARVKVATDSVKGAKSPKLKTIEKVLAFTLRPLRLFDMLDGDKNFKGPLVEMFDTAIQDATEEELVHVDQRQQRAKSKLKELGLNLFHFARRRKTGDVTLSIDDMMGIYAGWMNEESRLALQHGGIEMEDGKVLLVTDELYEQVLNALNNEEKKWAEFIIEEYADNWERIRNAFIDVENKDLGRRPNYTKMRRIGVDKGNENDILAGFDYSEEVDYRDGTVRVHDKFTKERQNIPPEYQLPIDPSLTRIWQGEVRKQEHYIAMAGLLKDLNAVVLDKTFADTVKEKFGDSTYKAVKDYLKRVADPDYYRTFDEIENLSRTLRKNTAVAYLAFNLLTVAKQGPSLALYAVNSSYSDMLMSAIQVAISPKKTYEAILSNNRQIGHAAIVREMEELKHANRKTWRFIVSRVGNAGLYGIYQVDRIVRVIGENAVINNQMRKGMSMAEAVKAARQTSLRTQPAAASKDIAQLYANNEVLNWFTMFTNQLNQIYNIATHDIPAAWYNRRFAEVGRSVMALSIVAMWIWALRNKELPDEREDVLDAMIDQSLAAIPGIGSAALAGKDGWNAPSPSIFTGTAKTAKAVTSGDMDKIMPILFEDVAILTGTPFIGTKRIYETAAEQDLWELIGGRK
jgi:hypothetical protein